MSKRIMLAAVAALIALPAQAQDYSRGMNNLNDCLRYLPDYDVIWQCQMDLLWRGDLQELIDQQNQEFARRRSPRRCWMQMRPELDYSGRTLQQMMCN
jgi:hypothetical protein